MQSLLTFETSILFLIHTVFCVENGIIVNVLNLFICRFVFVKKRTRNFDLTKSRIKRCIDSFLI